jgi:hypothetical protein
VTVSPECHTVEALGIRIGGFITSREVGRAPTREDKKRDKRVVNANMNMAKTLSVRVGILLVELVDGTGLEKL